MTYVNGIEKLRQLRLLCILGEHLFGNQAAITSARILPVDGLGIGEISLILTTSPLTVFTNLNKLHKVYTMTTIKPGSISLLISDVFSFSHP